MTLYQCSVCGEVHRSDEPACVQTFALGAPPVPARKRRYQCPDCRRVNPVWMDAAEYAEHQSMHVVTALRETMVFANHAEHRLRCIREKLDFCEGEPGTSALIRMIRFEVDEALDAARDGGSDE